MRILLFLAGLVVTFSASAQPPTKAEIERMTKNALAQKTDTAKIRMLLEIDDLIYEYDSDLDFKINMMALDIAEAALSGAKNSPKLKDWYNTQLIDIYSNLGNIHESKTNFKLSLQYHEQSLKLARSYKLGQKTARSLNNIGNVALNLENYKLSEQYFTEALAYFEKVEDTYRNAIICSNLGLVNKKFGNLSKALEFYFKSSGYAEKGNFTDVLAENFLLISNIYGDLNDTVQVREFLFKAIELANKTTDLETKYQVYINHAGYLGTQQRFEEAERILLESEKYYFERGNLNMSCRLNTNLASLAQMQGDTAKVKKWLTRALQSLEGVPENEVAPTIKAHLMFHLAGLAMLEGNVAAAKKYATEGYETALLTNEMESRLQTVKLLREIETKMGNHLEANHLADELFDIKDSLMNDGVRKTIMQLEARVEYASKAEKDSLLNLEKDATIAQQEAEAARNKTQRFALLSGLGLIVLFALFLVNRYRLINQQKKLITKQKEEVDIQRKNAEHQKEIVEEKNKEIIDSINYAKHIQQAILPSRESLNDFLKNGFLLYRPKDIVAGDFYWLEVLNDTLYVAVADCTGHGVPGAMVSVICSNALTKALQEEHITDPGKLLDRTRELVIHRFSKSGEEVKDGMDISLAALPVTIVGSTHDSTRDQRYASTLQWAGANNPLWIVRSKAGDSGSEPGEAALEQELIELKPDKQPIGKYASQKPFTTHCLDLQPGDTLYLFTDGYQDQFGGDASKAGGKKFKSANLKKLLLSIQHKEMDKHKEILEDQFEQWRGEIEQIDDVCMIGVRV